MTTRDTAAVLAARREEVEWRLDPDGRDFCSRRERIATRRLWQAVRRLRQARGA